MSKYMHKSPLSHICTNHSFCYIHSVTIWRRTSNSDLAITWFGAMPPARVLLYAQSHRQDSTTHVLCYTSRGALAGTKNSWMDPPWRTDPTIHRTMSESSYHELHPAPKYLISHLFPRSATALCYGPDTSMNQSKHLRYYPGLRFSNLS